VWESEGIAPPFLISAQDRGEWSQVPAAIIPGKAPGTHWIGGWDEVDQRIVW
jgi:hypothetical protein